MFDVTTLQRVLVAMSVVFGVSAFAQTTYPDVSNQLDAEIQILQKQEQLAAAKRRMVDPALSSLPQVVAVYGFEGSLKAKLMLSSGATLVYGEGESINPYMKIAAITTREVVVAVQASRKKKAKPVLAPLIFMAGSTNQPGMGGGTMGPTSPLPEGLLPPLPVLNPGIPQARVVQSTPNGQAGIPAPNAPQASVAPPAPPAPPAIATPAAPTAPAAAAPRRADQDLLDAKP